MPIDIVKLKEAFGSYKEKFLPLQTRTMMAVNAFRDGGSSFFKPKDEGSYSADQNIQIDFTSLGVAVRALESAKPAELDNALNQMPKIIQNLIRELTDFKSSDADDKRKKQYDAALTYLNGVAEHVPKPEVSHSSGLK